MERTVVVHSDLCVSPPPLQEDSSATVQLLYSVGRIRYRLQRRGYIPFQPVEAGARFASRERRGLHIFTTPSIAARYYHVQIHINKEYLDFFFFFFYMLYLFVFSKRGGKIYFNSTWYCFFPSFLCVFVLYLDERVF